MTACSPDKARLLLADDHVLVAHGVERLLLECFGQVTVVSTGEALVASVLASPPDVVVADISMTGISGLDAMRTLRASGVDVPFVFLTMHAEPQLAAEAIRAGACGYVLKTSGGDDLVRAIQEVLAGRTYVTPTLAVTTIRARNPDEARLTSKQRTVLACVAQGLRSKQIAHALGLSVRTVESHKYTIMQELGVHNTVELVRKATRAGLIEVDAPR
jgi:DNA-binding NarL/FixJ family response regulator